jgi:ATP-dependent helicase/nuclease subunit B
VAHHQEVVSQLVSEGTATPPFSTSADGKALLEMFDDIAAPRPAGGLRFALGDYPDLFRGLSDRTVRRPGGPDARVRIYGPLEARLQDVGRVVLGGLVEGVWPPETRSDPWLSRPMRRSLGLDLPERRISLSAHDFTQMLGADEVVLAYPAKLSGAPTVPSRFIQRLAAVAGEERWAAALPRGRPRFRSPRSRPGCATPIRSMRGTFSSSSRSTRSTRRPAHATAAPLSTAPSAASPWRSRTICRTTPSAS